MAIRPKMKQPTKESLNPSWHVVDASGKTLGRISSEIAILLQGKHKPEYVPYMNVGDYVVYRIIDDHTFEIKAIKNLSTTTPTIATDSKIAVINWQGTAVKAGVYDDQNGVFWEYDGKTLYAVLRTSTEKITGTISVNKDSHVITGVNTKFTDQLIVSDRVVINGMTYIVTSVSNDTEFTIAADYRGYRDQKAIKITIK